MTVIHKISIHALGGQGGGVLTDWIVALGEQQGYIAQATSVPGVAQRTGATVYYVELCAPEPGRGRPILALMPIAGDVDVVIASELMEAGRAVARGLVTSDRTTLVASTHRVFAISEKSVSGDGAANSQTVLAACEKSARKTTFADFQALAERNESSISATLFGALAGSGALPFPRKAFEDAVRAGGVGVNASLSAFAAAYEIATGAEPQSGETAREAPSTPSRSLDALRRRAAESLPAPALHYAALGLERLTDYQNRQYADLYLRRLTAFAEADRQFGGARFDWRLTTEAARRLALWMSVEDVIRVADLKTRPSRFARVRAEVRAAPTQIVDVSEFMHPRFEEFCDTLPRPLGMALKRSNLARRLLSPLFQRRQVRTSRLSGFLLLYLVARLRALRPITLRFHEENQRIEAWLQSALNAARADYDLGVEILRCQSLVKGYGDTYERGLRSFAAIVQTLSSRMEAPGAAAIAQRLRESGMKDESGAALLKEIRTLETPPRPFADAAT